ncbi:hypothetical protein FOCC_FOCC012789 [Frankliniella occidentalis]|nr:hypothetical protein FOCC_FOCC012789 [Frankliniella occidentalis]
MRCLLTCLLCLHGLQGLLGAATGRDVDLLLDLRRALDASPTKTTLTKRHVRSNDTDTDQDIWPKNVLLGAGLSACQAEGAWDKYGKAESIIDWVQHVPGNTLFPENAEVAADHYHRYTEDLALAKQMKFTSHRFSISWSRVLPTGGVDNINEQGVQFYKDYIEEVINNGMEPMVKYWNTVNEPNMYCNYFPTIMYLVGARPNEDDKIYHCMHNIIIAHMKTYQLYTKKYKEKQKGKLGTSVLMWPATPKTTQSEDVMAAETFNQVFSGALLHPLVFGDYPPVLRYLVEKRDAEKGLTQPRLPSFTAEEKEILAGGVTDFIALNVYSGCDASYNPNKTDNSKQSLLLGPVLQDMPFVDVSDFGGFGLRELGDEALMHDALIWIWSTYHVPIIISENGYGDTQGVGVNDTVRAAYHSANLRSLVRTMNEYGIDVLAYYAWSLLDVFEFTGGYFLRPFGIIHVDYKTGSLNRTLKDSAQFFIDLYTTGRVPYVTLPPEKGASGSTSPFIAAGMLLAAVFIAMEFRV